MSTENVIQTLQKDKFLQKLYLENKNLLVAINIVGSALCKYIRTPKDFDILLVFKDRESRRVFSQYRAQHRVEFLEFKQRYNACLLLEIYEREHSIKYLAN